jgi:hypothetical protein
MLAIKENTDRKTANSCKSSNYQVHSSTSRPVLRFKSVDHSSNNNEISYYDNIRLSSRIKSKSPPVSVNRIPVYTSAHLADDYWREIRERIKMKNDQASLIIPQFLYLGGHRSIKDVHRMFGLGITHVLNMARELRYELDHLKHFHHIKVLTINAHDSREYHIRADFEKAFEFIDDAFKNRGR